MNKLLVTAAACIAVFNASAQTKTTTTTKTKTSTVIVAPQVCRNSLDSFSYAAGMSVANSMKQAGADKLNVAMFAKAMNDVYGNKNTVFTKEQASMTLQEKLQSYSKKKTEALKQEGRNFLALNKKRSQVTSLPNGLQYEVISSGKGTAKPLAIDTVVVHYVGTLTNGSEFDNSVKRGSPASFPLNGVIKGWTEILQLMTPGDKWKVYIPSELGYGEYPPQGAAITPNAVLIFEIELLEIKPAAPAPTK